MKTVRTQSGVPRGTFFSKNGWAPTPSGQRLRVIGRSAMCASIGSATATKWSMTSPLVKPLAG
jgi:hypothetical protein